MKTVEIKAGQKAFSKKDAYATLQQALTDNATLSRNDVERLFLYFAPEKSAKGAKDAFSWVALASGVKEIRQCLNYAYSDGLTLWATDGHRMHWCPTLLEKGYYCPKTRARIPDMDGFKYPDCVRLLSAYAEESDSAYGSIESASSGSIIVEGRIRKQRVTGGLFNTAYLVDIKAGGSDAITKASDGLEPMRGITSFGGWLVMPTR